MKENADKARGLDAAEIAKQLRDASEQMFRLRFQMSMGQADGLKKLRKLAQRARADADGSARARTGAGGSAGGEAGEGDESSGEALQRRKLPAKKARR